MSSSKTQPAPQSSPSNAGADVEGAVRSAVVLGAGMVGLGTAIHLRKRGWRVTLVDPKGPGRETSYGNAGVISRGSIMAVSYPGIIKDIPKILMGRTNAVRVDIGSILSSLNWSLRFLANGTVARNEYIARALNLILEHALDEHRALMEESGSERHLRDTGWMKLYRSEKGFQKTKLECRLLDELGIDYDLLDGAGIAAREPHLNPIFTHGLHITGTASVDDPGAVCAEYGALFERLGGQIVTGAATEISELEAGVRVGIANGDPIDADHVVVAMGPMSDKLLKPIGVHLPLFHERGYHRHYKAQGNAVLQRPIYDAGGAFVIAPMARGIRVTSGVEIAKPDTPPTPRQIEAIMPDVEAAFPLAESLDDEPWFGRRPSLPDGLPAIGQVRPGSRVWVNFGHQHIGFTLGPVTGRILAEMMSGETPRVDPTAFSPNRF